MEATMDEKYQQFLEYNFLSDERYRQYIDGIFPAPTVSTLQLYKKKFYKKYVDPTFNISYAPPGSGPAPYDSSWVLHFQMMLFGLFCCTLPIGIMLKSHYPSMVLAGAFIIGLLYRHGIPKTNKEYWRAFLLDDDINNLVTLGICFVNFFGTVILWVPLLIVSMCYISERINQMSKRSNKAAWFMDLLTHHLADNKETLLEFKVDLEIYAGFYILVGLFMGWIPYLLPLLYWQLMQLRYLLNKRTHERFDKLGGQMDKLIESPNCPMPFKWILKKLKQFAAYINSMSETQQPPQKTEENKEETKEQKPKTEHKTEERPKVE